MEMGIQRLNEGGTGLIVALCVALFFFEGRWVVSQETARKCQKF
jgi:hypothetical protein